MDALEAATASGDAINGMGTHFMLDMDTYVHGAEIGFSGADFYVAGRGGALGWPQPTDDEVRAVKGAVRETWSEAQGATERAVARAFEELSEAERQELVDLVNSTQAAVTPG